MTDLAWVQPPAASRDLNNTALSPAAPVEFIGVAPTGEAVSRTCISRTHESGGVSDCPGPAPGSTGGHVLPRTSSNITPEEGRTDSGVGPSSWALGLYLCALACSVCTFILPPSLLAFSFQAHHPHTMRKQQLCRDCLTQFQIPGLLEIIGYVALFL